MRLRRKSACVSASGGRLQGQGALASVNWKFPFGGKFIEEQLEILEVEKALFFGIWNFIFWNFHFG